MWIILLRVLRVIGRLLQLHSIGVKKIIIIRLLLQNSVKYLVAGDIYTYCVGNTVSNLGYIIAGALGFYQCLRVKSSIPPRYAFLFAWMAVIGIGSLLFHATLLYSMQLLDEIPMLFSNSQMLYVL